MAWYWIVLIVLIALFWSAVSGIHDQCGHEAHRKDLQRAHRIPRRQGRRGADLTRTAGDAPPGIQRTGAVCDRPGVILPENLSACRAHGCRPRNIYFLRRTWRRRKGWDFLSSRPLRGRDDWEQPESTNPTNFNPRALRGATLIKEQIKMNGTPFVRQVWKDT